MIQLVSEYFEIQQIAYNYAKLYSAIEIKLSLIRDQSLNYLRLISTSDTEYKHWQDESESGLKSKFVDFSRKLVSRIPFTKPLICGSLNLIARMIQIVLGWTFIPTLLLHATKWFLGDGGQTHIIILAKK